MISDIEQDYFQKSCQKYIKPRRLFSPSFIPLPTRQLFFCPVDIFNALKNAKSGKACGVDGLAAEHFIYADAIIHIHLSFIFNSFISHGYLPRDFMKTAIVPIIKNKSGNFSDKAN